MTVLDALVWSRPCDHATAFQQLVDFSGAFRSVPRQSGGYIRYAQRQVRTVFNLVTGAVLGQGCCLPVVFLPVRTVQTVQKTLTSAQFWVGRRHARWCANDRALVRQWRKLVPQLQFFAGRHPDPHGPDYSTDHRDHCCFPYLVVDVPGVLAAQILRCKRGGDSRLPQLQLLRNLSRFCTCSTSSWLMSLLCRFILASSLGRGR